MMMTPGIEIAGRPGSTSDRLVKNDYFCGSGRRITAGIVGIRHFELFGTGFIRRQGRKGTATLIGTGLPPMDRTISNFETL